MLNSADSFATAIGDRETLLEVAIGVHEPPLTLPAVGGGVVDVFPGLVEGFEPVLSYRNQPSALMEIEKKVMGGKKRRRKQ